MTVALCLSCSLRCSTRGLGVHCWMLAFFMASYQHLLWTPAHQSFKPHRPGVAFLITSRLLTLWKSAGNFIGGFPLAPSVGCGLPYHIWSLLSGILLATALAPNSTQLYNNSTPTRSPTGPLKSNI